LSKYYTLQVREPEPKGVKKWYYLSFVRRGGQGTGAIIKNVLQMLKAGSGGPRN